MNAHEVAQRIAEAGGGQIKPGGSGGYLVTCPAHADHDPSLHVSTGKAQAVVLKCLAGCTTEAVLAVAGLDFRSLCTEATYLGRRIDAEYAYTNEAGDRLFVIWRFGHGKGRTFSCCSFDEAGRQVHNARKVARVLYHLPKVIAAVANGEEIYICEGEKDADAMITAYGIVATTNPFGATAWANDCERWGYAGFLVGASVVIVQHRDAKGRARTRQILTSLRGVAGSVRVVEAAEGNDAFDHIEAGRPLDAFRPVEPTHFVDDGHFAGLPSVLFEAASAVNLTHLEHRVFIEIARHSIDRTNHKTAWKAVECPSSWLAKQVGNASAPGVRAALGRLCKAGILLDEGEDASGRRTGRARVLRVNDDYDAWRPIERGRGVPTKDR